MADDLQLDEGRRYSVNDETGSFDLILKVPGINGVDECWALDCYSRPGEGQTEVGLLVRRAKYGRMGPPAAELGKRLGQWGLTLADQRKWPDNLVIVPVPSSADLVGALIRNVATAMRRPVSFALRTRGNRRIKLLPLIKRQNAARSSMMVRTRDVPKNVLLIDDVVQSGATLAAAAEALRAAGATTVFALVAARVVGPGMAAPDGT